MRETCSMHCGHFTGVPRDVFDREKASLEELFDSVRYEDDVENLHLCGARELPDLPKDLTGILNKLASLLSEKGRGRIMMRCEGLTEVCYFRRNMWKLVGIDLPPDPFEGVHYVE